MHMHACMRVLQYVLNRASSLRIPNCSVTSDALKKQILNTVCATATATLTSMQHDETEKKHTRMQSYTHTDTDTHVEYIAREQGLWGGKEK